MSFNTSMLGRICNLSYGKNYPTRMKNFFQRGIGYDIYADVIPKVKNSVVGKLPPEIISLAVDDKKFQLVKFQELLGDISNYLRAVFLHWDDANGQIDSVFKDFVKPALATVNNLYSQKLSQLFPNKPVNINLNLAGHGEFAKVYRLSINDALTGEKIMHDKALKVYHSVLDHDKRWHFTHGNYAEANFWTFLKHIAGHSLSKTQFVKHYISDMKNAYALTEFIDNDIQKTTSELDYTNLLRIANFDRYDNKPINGKIYDVGLFCAERDFINDKMVLRYLKKLYYRNSKKDLIPVLKNLELQAKNTKQEHREKIQKSIDIFKKRFPERIDM